MTAKPTALPEWGTDEILNVEPTSGEKASGWTNGQVPPAGYFNWYQFTVWKWIEFLNQATGVNPTNGSWYHGDETVVVPAAAFQATGGSGASINTDGEWVFTAVSIIQAAIPVPVGRQIKSVRWHYNRGGAGTMLFKTQKRNPGSAATNLSSDSVASGTGWTTRDAVAINYTLGSDAGYTYFLEVEIDNAAHVFSHAIVTYDYPQP